MIPLQTKVRIEKPSFKIDHNHKIISLGSCFAQHTGEFLSKYKFNLTLNPFGIIYNPATIYQSINRLISGREFSVNDLFENNGLWHSYNHHGRFSSLEAEKTVTMINSEFREATAMIKKADIIIATLGTAWIYRLSSTGHTVANCHKVPDKNFERVLLDIPEIVELISNMIQEVNDINPSAKWIFSVSPVRHLKDGAVGNNQSKSHLLAAVHAVLGQHPHAYYFPAYEIVMDELRDYRFYDKDMVHPNAIAREYVWVSFSETCFSQETQQINQEIKKSVQAADHRILNPGSPEIIEFAKSQLKRIEKLKSKFPGMDWTTEQLHFSELLKSRK